MDGDAQGLNLPLDPAAVFDQITAVMEYVRNFRERDGEREIERGGRRERIQDWIGTFHILFIKCV